MSSIGPQLPPHLAKRKRTPDDDSGDESPPAKTTRIGPSAPSTTGPATNADEIDLDDSDSDSCGPSAPAPAPRIAGPTLPPSTSPKPAPRTAGPTLPPSSSPKPTPKRIHGPAPPPASLAERPPNPPSDSDSDSDSYGPALPSASSEHTAVAQAHQPSPSTEPAPLKRNDWMLVPPTSSSARAPDPTRLKARKFASGPRAASSNGPSEISSIWTETAAQKSARLRDEVLGRAAGASKDERSPAQREKDRRVEERDERIRAKIEGARGRSLYEEHQGARERGREEGKKGGKKIEEEDDPSKRAFDIEKDMAVGGAISGSQRREWMSKAKDFGGRFQKGSFL